MEKEEVAVLLEENMKTIFAYALSRVSHKEDAEDLAGDIIAEILESAPRLKDDNAFFGYIWAIAANTYKKFLRKRNCNQFSEFEQEIVSEENILDEICNSEEINALRRELSLLSREYRDCTIAYYFNGLSCAETASRLHISLEMVKYYLFKTRKILKEGIGMERKFGEKSYNPGTFEFNTIFSDKYNAEYVNLFSRKLPGNILLSAYYTPMTIRELSIELGVASVYLEDEIALLEKYHLLTALNGGKYQANLVIFTEAYMNEFYRTVEQFCITEVGSILNHVQNKLSEIRSIGFIGANLDDNSLLWPLLWMLMRNGHCQYKNALPAASEPAELYNGATGTNYGIDYDTAEKNEYNTGDFAGYSKIDNDYAAAFADFGILPKKNHFHLRDEEIREKLYAAIAGKQEAEFMVLSRQETAAVETLIQPETDRMQSLYNYLGDCAVKIMKVHTPKNVAGQVENIANNTLFFHTVGLIGACAANSGALSVPKHDKPTALYIYRTTEDD